MATDGDSAMDAYAYVLEQLHENNCRRLRAFSPDGPARFTTWLVVVARRLCLDYRRSRYGRQKTDVEPIERDTRRRLEDLIGADIDPASMPDTNPRTVEADLMSAELKAGLAHVLEALPARERLLLAMRFEDGQSVPRIAQQLGYLTPFHAYRHLNAVLDRLREQLRDKGIDGPGP